jgi:hypothetical protein
VSSTYGLHLDVGHALGLGDDEVIEAIGGLSASQSSDAPQSATRFRRPRRYFISDASFGTKEFIPLPELRARYCSSEASN